MFNIWKSNFLYSGSVAWREKPSFELGKLISFLQMQYLDMLKSVSGFTRSNLNKIRNRKDVTSHKYFYWYENHVGIVTDSKKIQKILCNPYQVWYNNPSFFGIKLEVYTFNRKEVFLMKHVKTLNTRKLQNTVKKGGCGECQTSCQSACKTSCTVGNQSCENK